MRARALIVLLGETRAHELTFALFKKNLLDRLEADLALCVGENAREGPNEFYAAAKYAWRYKDPKDWGEAFEDFAPGKNWRALLELPDQWFGGIRHPTLEQAGTGALLIFFREFLRRSIEVAGILEDYDWFIITRSDFMWPIPHPDLGLFSERFIYMPDGERYRGYTDRHVMVPRQLFRPFMEIARAAFEDPEALAARMKARSKENWNTESFVKFRLEELGLKHKVRFFPYLMYTVKALGGTTAPGAPGYDDFQQRLYLKYPLEYSTARALQCVIIDDDDWKGMIGPARYFCWRFYLFAWLRVLAEKNRYARRLRFLRLARRFLVYVLQPN